MSVPEAAQPQGMPLRGAAGGEEQVPLAGGLCHGHRAPRVASCQHRTAPRAGHPRLPAYPASGRDQAPAHATGLAPARGMQSIFWGPTRCL